METRLQVMDGVKETGASSTSGGGVTKEALTGSCDMAEQTAGPR